MHTVSSHHSIIPSYRLSLVLSVCRECRSKRRGSSHRNLNTILCNYLNSLTIRDLKGLLTDIKFHIDLEQQQESEKKLDLMINNIGKT
jgi:hypothetical protein